jgi:pyridoxal phosphate enzyme (YggS family)
MTLQDHYKKVTDSIAAAAIKARRNPADVTLVAVTKNATPDAIRQLVELGHCDLGESRVQQLQQRAAQLDEFLQRNAGRAAVGGSKSPPAPSAVRWHMIGHLQRNKVRAVLPLVKMIHSIDSLRLAEEIQDESQRFNLQHGGPGTRAAAQPAGAVPHHPTKGIEVLLEVNVAGEGSKFGVAVGAAIHLAEQIDTMDDVQLVGLMCMAPFSENPEAARPTFVRLRELFDEIKFRKIGGDRFRHLSMGMSGDYTVAVEEGATLVRVGTALFGTP